MSTLESELDGVARRMLALRPTLYRDDEGRAWLLPPEQIEEVYACEDKYHAYQELGVEAGAHFASAHARPHELEGINAASQGLNVSIWLPTIWEVAIQKHQVPDVYVGAFVTGFMDGMLYVWEQVKPRLVEALEKQEP